MVDNIIKYSGVQFVNLTIYEDNNIRINVDVYVPVNRKRLPFVYFDPDRVNDSPRAIISSLAYKPYFANLVYNKTLFISPESKLSRDLVRNSGYTITYSKDKADYVVIPKPNSNAYQYYTNLLILDTITNKLYVCSVNNLSYSHHYDKDYIIKKIIDRLDIDPGNMNSLEYESNDNVYTSFSIWFFSAAEEHIELLMNPKKSSKYILDCNLPLTPANKLSVETLDLWRRLAVSDDNLFEKSILNSDAREYPFTMYNFLYFDNELRYKSKPNKIRWLMESMGIKEDWPGYKQIEPKDLNLLQDYISYLLGVEGKSGYVSSQQYNNLPYQYQKLLMTRFAVAPVRINEPMSLLNIQTMAKNN